MYYLDVMYLDVDILSNLDPDQLYCKITHLS